MSLRNLASLALMLAAGALGTAAASGQASAPIPSGAGLDLINERCAFCHTTAQVLSVRKTPADWAATVQAMIDRGAELDPDEQKVMVEYLAANFAQGEGEALAHH
jgi:cytochrome c5